MGGRQRTTIKQGFRAERILAPLDTPALNVAAPKLRGYCTSRRSADTIDHRLVEWVTALALLLDFAVDSTLRIAIFKAHDGHWGR